MQWENLTSLDFANAVQACQGVGLVAVGVLEPHAAHLPLGTDALAAHWSACRAAMLAHEVAALAALIRLVKADRVTPALVAEFNQATQQPRPPESWTE